MADPWERFWESRYQQRHGYPSRSERADLERQAAFLDDIFAHATPSTDLHMLRALLDDLNEATMQYQWRQQQRELLERARIEVRNIHRRLLDLQPMAEETGTDLTDTILREIQRSCAPANYWTNQGTAIGYVPTIHDLRANVNRAAEIVVGRCLRQRAGRTSHSLNGEISADSQISTHRGPLRGLEYDPASLSGILGTHSLPNYMEAIHGVQPVRLTEESPLQMRANQSEVGVQLSKNEQEIVFCPRFEPSRYPWEQPPEYWNSAPGNGARGSRRRQGSMRESEESDSLLYRPGRDDSILDSVRRISSQFNTDPRNIHTPRSAERLGILHQIPAPGLWQNERRQTISAQVSPAPLGQIDMVYTLGKKRSLGLLRIDNTGDYNNDEPISGIAEDLYGSIPAKHFGRDDIPSDIQRHRENPTDVDCRSERSAKTPKPMTLGDENEDSDVQTFSWAESLSLDFESDEEDLDSIISENSLLSSIPDIQVPVTSPSIRSYAEALKYGLSHHPNGPGHRLKCFSQASHHLSDTHAPVCSRAYLAETDKGVSTQATVPEENDCGFSEPFEEGIPSQQKISEHRASQDASETIMYSHDFGSAEYLAKAHSYKNAADTLNSRYHRIMQRHEQDMQRIATDIWLPTDSHRRNPNTFELLVIDGDSSLQAYSRADTASQNHESELQHDPDDAGRAHLRGGSNSALKTRRNAITGEMENQLFGNDRASRDVMLSQRFINSRGNEYFCDIDEEYLTDRFNLTSLNTEVQYYQYALDLITDVLDIDVDDDTREQIEKSARHLYGLVHARYIVTTRGLQKMCDKYKNGDFGKCPRVACDGQPLLPMGQHDSANVSAVKLYCARCEDLYNPKSSRHASVDGAYFGSSFHNMFFQVYPNLMPPKSQRRYEPKIFGFKVHGPATLARWQGARREDVKETLRLEGLETGFEDEEREEEMEASEEEIEERGGQDGIDDMFEGQRVAY